MDKEAKNEKGKVSKIKDQLISKGLDSTLLAIPFIGWILLGIKRVFGIKSLGVLLIIPICCCLCILFLFIEVGTAVASKDFGEQIGVAQSLINAGCADEGLGTLINIKASGTDFGECLVEDTLKGEDSIVFQRNFKTQNSD